MEKLGIFKKSEFVIEEILIIIMLFIDIADFFRLLPDALVWMDDFLAFFVLGLLLYRLSFTSLLFGQRHRRMDLFIIIFYFLFAMKDVLATLEESLGGITVNKGIGLILDYASSLQFIAFAVAALFFLLLSIYATGLDIKKPSFMAVLHEEGKPSSFLKSFVRFLTLFIVFIGFYLLLFNLFIDWIAIALDAPLVILAIVVFILARRRRKLLSLKTLLKLGEFGERGFGESFLRRFVSFFHYKKTILLGFSGLLVFHPLTDLAIFILAYVTGFFDPIYFSRLGSRHIAIPTLIMQDLPKVSFAAKIPLFGDYILNILAMTLLLLVPAFVWYMLFRNRELHVNNYILALFASSLLSFLLMPAFTLGKVSAGTGIIGVDISTQSILEARTWFTGFISGEEAVIAAFLIAVTAAISILFLRKKELKKKVFIGALIIAFYFFGFYTYYFFSSSYSYYLSLIASLFTAAKPSSWFMGMIFIVFAMITLLFYLFSYILLVYEAYFETHHAKWSNPTEELQKDLHKIREWEREHLPFRR